VELIPEIDIKKKVPEIRDLGYVKSMRKSDTGIGFTFETLMGIKENNLKNHDFTYNGVGVECKTRRRKTSANLTLFTKEPSIRLLHDVELMKKYGYNDLKNRLALKPDCVFQQFNPQGLGLAINERKGQISLIDRQNYRPWTWIPEDISTKMKNLLLVFADSKKENGKEYFHYDEAYYLKNFEQKKFLELVKKKKIVVNLRMHQKTTGGSRNRGTGFRIRSTDELILCYKNKIKII